MVLSSLIKSDKSVVNCSQLSMQPVRKLSIPGSPDGIGHLDGHFRRFSEVSESEKQSEETVVVEKKKSSYTKRQWTILVVFCFMNIGAGMCYSLQAPFYPKEADKKGVSSSVYGFVFGVFELVDFILCPIFGKKIRLIGPNFMFIAGNFVMSVCCILFGLLDKVAAGTPFIALSFIIRIVEASGQAGFITASYAIIAQEFPDNIASTFSAVETVFAVGTIVGPTVGGVLYELGGFFLPFAIVGSVLLATSCVAGFLLPPIKESPEKPGSLIKLVLLPGIAICYYSVVAVAISFGFTTALLEPHLRPFNLSPSLLGLLFVISGGTYALTASIWGYIADKFIDPKILCGIGAIFTTIGFLLIGPAPFFPLEPTLWMIILALVFHGIGSGGEYVAPFLDSSQEAMRNGYPNNIETYGMISGLWASGLALGSFIGPSVAGVLNDAIGFRNSSLVVVGLHIIVIILSFGFYLWRKSRDQVTSVNETTPLIESSTETTPT